MRIEMKAEEITELASEEWFSFVRTFYHDLLVSIEKGLLGGAIVYAANQLKGRASKSLKLTGRVGAAIDLSKPSPDNRPPQSELL